MVQSGDGALGERRVLVGVSGGIACYKTATLVSRLVQAGADVRVIMTEAATRFVGPVTFEALSGRSVLSSIWQSDDHPESQHVGLARWCELMLIAPASADMIARLAHGLTGDVVSLTAAALPRDAEGGLTTPLVVAPAMNADMWASPIVQQNMQILTEIFGASQVGPDTGWQACRTAGPGRMSEADAIFDAVAKILKSQ